VEMYDFGNRNYDPTIARFYNMDKFSEKYVDKTPYHYTANNPIYFVDIKGDSLVVNGASSGLAKFESIVNKGLGGHYTISQNNSGKYILNDTGSDKSTMTNSQKSFYNTMNESATNAGDVVFTVIEHSGTASNKVFVGDHGGYSDSASPGNHLIDIDDVAAFGDKGLLTSQGALAHEIKEGFEIQINGMEPTDAHYDKAIPAENMVNGNISLGAEFNSSGNIEVKVATFNSDGGMPSINVQTVELNFNNGNLSSGGVINNN